MGGNQSAAFEVNWVYRDLRGGLFFWYQRQDEQEGFGRRSLMIGASQLSADLRSRSGAPGHARCFNQSNSSHLKPGFSTTGCEKADFSASSPPLVSLQSSVTFDLALLSPQLLPVSAPGGRRGLEDQAELLGVTATGGR